MKLSSDSFSTAVQIVTDYLIHLMSLQAIHLMSLQAIHSMSLQAIHLMSLQAIHSMLLQAIASASLIRNNMPKQSQYPIVLHIINDNRTIPIGINREKLYLEMLP